MAELQRNPRDVVFDSDAEYYQRLSQKHQQYESELLNITNSPYHNSEDFIEEIRLKKLKLRVKDEMERVIARNHLAPDRRSQ